MTKPEDISEDVRKQAWGIYLKRCDEVSRLAAEFEEEEVVDLLARAILAATEAERERIAAYIEGKGGVIPGAAVFAPLVSRNNQPCMSGDPRDRLHSHVRRVFDDATASLAAAIRTRTHP